MVPAVLAGLKVGNVSYLNARPLAYGIEDAVFLAPPSVLAKGFADGLYDVALLPVFELLREGGGTSVDGISISARGEVYSVFLAHKQPIASLQEIVLDNASRTSVNLLRVLLAEVHLSNARLVSTSNDPDAARLLIGDQAIRFRLEAGEDWNFYDLSVAWKQMTGLPFVFAVWGLRPGLNQAGEVAACLREVREAGLAERKAIAAGEADPAFALKYLTDYIRYDLGDEEKQAVALFDKLLRKHAILPATPPARMEYL